MTYSMGRTGGIATEWESVCGIAAAFLCYWMEIEKCHASSCL